jgi:hypothetical protein
VGSTWCAPVIELGKRHVAAGADCSRRRPVIQALRVANMRASGSSLRSPQQALRNSTERYIASSPWLRTKCTTASSRGRCSSICTPYRCSVRCTSASVCACSLPVSSVPIAIGSWCVRSGR